MSAGVFACFAFAIGLGAWTSGYLFGRSRAERRLKRKNGHDDGTNLLLDPGRPVRRARLHAVRSHRRTAGARAVHRPS